MSDRVKPPEVAAAEKRLADIKHPSALFVNQMIVENMVDFFQEHVAPEIKALKSRIAELEAQPYLREAGVWDNHISYGTGAVVSHGGSAWICRCPTTARPGTNSDWRLFVKRGKDARL